MTTHLFTLVQNFSPTKVDTNVFKNYSENFEYLKLRNKERRTGRAKNNEIKMKMRETFFRVIAKPRNA